MPRRGAAAAAAPRATAAPSPRAGTAVAGPSPVRPGARPAARPGPRTARATAARRPARTPGQPQRAAAPGAGAGTGATASSTSPAGPGTSQRASRWIAARTAAVTRRTQQTTVINGGLHVLSANSQGHRPGSVRPWGRRLRLLWPHRAPPGTDPHFRASVVPRSAASARRTVSGHRSASPRGRDRDRCGRSGNAEDQARNCCASGQDRSRRPASPTPFRCVMTAA